MRPNLRPSKMYVYNFQFAWKLMCSFFSTCHFASPSLSLLDLIFSNLPRTLSIFLLFFSLDSTIVTSWVIGLLPGAGIHFQIRDLQLYFADFWSLQLGIVPKTLRSCTRIHPLTGRLHFGGIWSDIQSALLIFSHYWLLHIGCVLVIDFSRLLCWYLVILWWTFVVFLS